MPVLDLTQAELPDWNKGVPVGRGMLHYLVFNWFPPAFIAGDNLDVRGKVPADEHWYVLQWSVQDLTNANTPNGWEAQLMFLELDRWEVTETNPPAQLAANLGTLVWNRWWDGKDYLTWDSEAIVGFPEFSRLIVRCTDPVWSMPRWPAGMQWRTLSFASEEPSAGSLRYFTEMVVLRFRQPDYDFKRLLQEDGVEFLFKDLHMQEHRPVLGQ